ncbi:hypothetical protein ABIE65_001745 [Constrictibacter sp. MBR-5]|jgi:hypothetical protein|uniref:DUF3618 domain-containing protein n=1 Tax=Constrictibacter sp. MBR-5 TaxID=3156467 RepID=UPI0033982442
MSRSPEEIERDIEATRASLVATVGEIERRLTPGRILDDMLDGALNGRDRSDFVELVRRHPIPVALVGAGLVWLLLSGKRKPRRAAAPPAPRDEWTERLPPPAHAPIMAEPDPLADPHPATRLHTG